VPPVPVPLTNDHFEMKRKEVYKAPTFVDRTGRAGSDPYAKNLLEFRSRIEQGLELPPKFYRNGIGTTTDDLLQHTGVKHVHLGATKSDVLLFVEEFDDFVVLLEIAGHDQNFWEVPVGATLKKHHLDSLEVHLPGFAATASAAREKAKKRQRIAAAGAKAAKPSGRRQP